MSGGRSGSIFGTAQSLQDVARDLENQINVPVFDETGLKGTYNYSVASKLSALEAGIDFAHQLGLELTPAERSVEMLVVRKVE